MHSLFNLTYPGGLVWSRIRSYQQCMLYSAHELSDVYSFCLGLFFHVAMTSGYLKLLVRNPLQGQYVGTGSILKFVC